MQELIKITEQEGKQAVSARELYEFLGFNKAVWKRWYEKNIVKNPYAVEYEDWEGFNIELNGNETMDFALSLDFAKRLSMLARTDKGEQIRKYFIACEKKLKEEALKAEIPQSFSEALLLAAQQQQKIELQEKELREAAPKVQYVDNVLLSSRTYTSTQVAKSFDFRSAEAFHLHLKELNVMFKKSGQWMLTADYCGNGYTKTRTHEYTSSTGQQQTNTITVWTEEGRRFLFELLKAKQIS